MMNFIELLFIGFLVYLVLNKESSKISLITTIMLISVLLFYYLYLMSNFPASFMFFMSTISGMVIVFFMFYSSVFDSFNLNYFLPYLFLAIMLCLISDLDYILIICYSFNSLIYYNISMLIFLIMFFFIYYFKMNFLSKSKFMKMS